MNRLARIFKIGPHYAIERFGIEVGMLVVALVVFVVASTSFTMHTNAEIDAAQALYTSSFKTTASATSGKVEGIYENEAKTRAAVLVKISDMSELTIDASKYKANLVGVDGFGYVEGVQAMPECGLYVYGDSGYIVFYMVNAEPFPHQKLALNVNMGLSMTGSDVSSATAEDTWTIQFNPGASGVSQSEALESDTFDPVAFYRETVVASQETELREALVNDISRMRTELTSINEYTTRVRSDGVSTDGMTPEWLAGDTVSIADGVMSYKPATVLDGGLSFDWAACSITGQSYIETAMAAAGMGDVDAFMTSLVPLDTPSVGGQPWLLSDGTPLRSALEESPSNTRYQQASDDVASLESHWAVYGSLKARYQGEDLYALLELEYEGDKIGEVYTSTTTNDGTIVVEHM